MILNKIVRNYYSDKFYIDVGDPLDSDGINKVETKLMRRLVRKVNLYVSVHDDSCFNWCGKGEDDRIKCKEENCNHKGK